MNDLSVPAFASLIPDNKNDTWVRGLYQFRWLGTGEDILQGEENFEVICKDGRTLRISLWDYKMLYRHPFLYESIFHDKLHLYSPEIITTYFFRILDTQKSKDPLRILDLGAGSGLVGVELRKDARVQTVVGVDILPKAKEASLRDHPNTYDGYYVMDLSQLSQEEKDLLWRYRINCLMVVSATGGGGDEDVGYKDVDLIEYEEAFFLLEIGGFIIFNVREHYTKGQIAILEKLKQVCDILGSKVYRHRYLANGTAVNNEVFVMRKVHEWI